MKINSYLYHLLRIFSTNCSCIIVGTAVFLQIFSVDHIESSILWQILFISFASSVFGIFYHTKGEALKKFPALYTLIHYLTINIFLFSWAYFFNWINFHEPSILISFGLTVLIVYLIGSVLIRINSHTQAKLLNKKLEEYKRNKE